MHKARLARAAFSPLVCLLLLSISLLSGCGGLLTGPLREAEDNVSTGKPLKGEAQFNKALYTPDVMARKKLALAMNTLIKGDFSYPDVKAVLRSIQKDPYTARDLKVEAGYMLTLVEKLDAKQKELDQMRQRYEKCLKEKDDIAKEKEMIIQEKDEIIAGITKERDDLAFKLKKLEEIYTLTERRRGLRK